MAYLELHERGEVTLLAPESTLVSAAKQKRRASFVLHGVDYYPHVSGSEVPALLNQGYDYLILDLGSLAEADHCEFLRCDHKIILGSLAPWKTRKYEDFFTKFDNTVNLGEGFYYLVQMGANQNILRFSKAHRIAMLDVPFIKNPFRIEKALFLFFEELLTSP